MRVSGRKLLMPESRFDSLFGEIQKPAEEKASNSLGSKCLDVQTSKSKNPDYQRTTIYIPKTLHARFKASAALCGKDMSDILADLVDEWVNKNNDLDV